MDKNNGRITSDILPREKKSIYFCAVDEAVITHSTAIDGSTVTEVENRLLFDKGIGAQKPLVEQMMNLDLKAAVGSQKSSQKIIEFIKEDAGITTQQMADRLGITRRAVAKAIAKLQAEGIIRRVGPDKGSHWKIIKNE